MKRLLLALVLAVACLGLLAAPALAGKKTSPSTFYVSPSGSAATDTTNIQTAFGEAIAAGPGSTVQLGAGQFYMTDTFVVGFQGTFKGAGEGKTVIDCPSGGVSVVDTLNNMPFTYLLGFQDSAVTVSDMSFDITPTTPTAALWSGFGWTDASFIEAVVCTLDDTTTAFDRVSFASGVGDASGFPDFPNNDNVDEAVVALGDSAQSGGTYTMDGCTSTTPEGFWAHGLSGASVAIGSSQGNVFESTGAACAFWENSDSTFTVTGNQFQAGNQTGQFFPNSLYSAGVSVIQGQEAYYGVGPLPTPSRYLVSHNNFRVGPPADGVDLFDFGASLGAVKLIDAVVSDNTMVLSGSLDLPQIVNAGGIGDFYTQDVSVLNNRISGTGLAGIFVGTDLTGDNAPGSVSGWLIRGNNVGGLTAQVAPIWLGPGTTGCTVIGGAAKTNVLDQGIGNILTGVTRMRGTVAHSMASHGASKLALVRRLH